MVKYIFLYACDKWTLTFQLQQRIQAGEMSWLQTILGISYTDHVSNNKIWELLQREGHYEYLLSTVRRCKLMWYGHVVRSSGMSKTILQGTLPWSRKRGRPKMQWPDNVSQWTKQSLRELQNLAWDHRWWKQLVHSAQSGSAVCLQSRMVKGLDN